MTADAQTTIKVIDHQLLQFAHDSQARRAARRSDEAQFSKEEVAEIDRLLDRRIVAELHLVTAL